MRSLLSILLLCFNLPGFAQDFQKEINDQVWKPFISTFSNRNTKGFLTLHSKDLVWSARDSKQILNWDEYLALREKSNKRNLAEGISRMLELRFSERIANSDRAIDVGIYKMTVTDKTGESTSHYGRFHVILRKENGVWKILVDTDSSEGQTIGEQEFLAATAME